MSMDESRARNAPVKPRRSTIPETDESDHEYSSPVRRHRTIETPSPLEAQAETTIGHAVKMKGELSFERLLRIDGEFEGRLMSKGSLIIGNKGCLIGNVENMKEVHIIGGKLIGNISVEKVVLKDKCAVFGNITAKSVRVDAECVIIGNLNVNPHAPQGMNEKGEPISG